MAVQRAVVTDRVREILRASWMDGELLCLTPELPRDDYEAVATVLKDWGGKWNRHQGGHVFTGGVDIEQKLGEVDDKGSYDSRKANAFYETPTSLILDMINIQIPWWEARILEPSAGRGAILDELLRNGANQTNIDTCEIMPDHQAILRGKGYRIVAEDFLQFPSPPVYDLIFMNPPFDKGADAKHILHAAKMLSPDGALVAIATPAIEYRTTKVHTQLRSLIEECGGTITRNPPGSFKAAGTAIETVMISLQRDEGAYTIALEEPVDAGQARQLSLIGG